MRPAKLGEQEQSDSVAGKEETKENIGEKDKTEKPSENLPSETQNCDRTSDAPVETSDTLQNTSEDIPQDIISEKEKGVLDIRKEDSVVESVENSSPCKEEEEPRLVSEEPEELPDLEEVPDIAMLSVSIEKTSSNDVFGDSAETSDIKKKSIEGELLVPRWDRAHSTSSQEDLPEPPSDCELGEIRHELPTPPQDEELQLLAAHHHDLPPPPPEVFEPLPTEDLPILKLDSDSDAPPPPLPSSVPSEPYVQNEESESGTIDNIFPQTELPSELNELESQVANMEIKSSPEGFHLETDLNLLPPPPKVIMDEQSAPEQSVVLSSSLDKQDVNDYLTNPSIEIEEHEGTQLSTENLPEAGELLEKLVTSIAELTKAPEDENDQTSSPEVTHVQEKDGDVVQESDKSEKVSPSEDGTPEEICPPAGKKGEVSVLSTELTCPAEPPLTSLPRQEPLRPSPSPLKDSSLPPLEAKAVLACPSPLPLPKPTAIVKPCLPPSPPSPPISSPCKAADADDGVLPAPADITVMTTLSADSSIVTPIKSQETEEEVSSSSADPPSLVSDFKVTETSSRREQETLPVQESSHAMMSEQAVGEELKKEEEEDVPVPPAKGYNLDFLDKLDDPNFNPFETKTAVLNNFDSSAPVPVGETSVKDEGPVIPGENDDSPKPETKPKKPPMKKPLARKPLLRKPVKKPIEPVEEKTTEASQDGEDNLPAVPKKSYNMDFLDQLDDPNFNPFETKTAVKAQFDTSAPVDELPTQAVEQVSNEKVTESVESKAEEPEKPAKKPLPKKPWLKKPALKKKAAQPPLAESDPAKDEEDDLPAPASKGYNLDFLDKMDDPNFNPFETKAAVIEKFDSSAPQESPTPKETNNKTDKSTSQEQKTSASPAKEEPVPESKEKEATARKPWLKKPPVRKELDKEEKPAKADNEAEEEERVPVPGKAYNLDFLDKLDDPNFNPFETKSSVTNAPDRLSENNKTLDLQPDNDETSNDQKMAKGLKDDTPGFEATEALIVGSPSLPGEAEKLESRGTFPVESPSLPVEESPISQQSSGYSSLPRSTQQLLAQPPNDGAEDLSLW